MKVGFCALALMCCGPARGAYISFTHLADSQIVPGMVSFCEIEPSEKIQLCGIWITFIECYEPRAMDPSHSICLSHSSNSFSHQKESCEFQETTL